MASFRAVFTRPSLRGATTFLAISHRNITRRMYPVEMAIHGTSAMLPNQELKQTMVSYVMWYVQIGVSGGMEDRNVHCFDQTNSRLGDTANFRKTVICSLQCLSHCMHTRVQLFNRIGD